MVTLCFNIFGVLLEFLRDLAAVLPDETVVLLGVMADVEPIFANCKVVEIVSVVAVALADEVVVASPL